MSKHSSQVDTWWYMGILPIIIICASLRTKCLIITDIIDLSSSMQEMSCACVFVGVSKNPTDRRWAVGQNNEIAAVSFFNPATKNKTITWDSAPRCPLHFRVDWRRAEGLKIGLWLKMWLRTVTPAWTGFFVSYRTPVDSKDPCCPPLNLMAFGRSEFIAPAVSGRPISCCTPIIYGVLAGLQQETATLDHPRRTLWPSMIKSFQPWLPGCPINSVWNVPSCMIDWTVFQHGPILLAWTFTKGGDGHGWPCCRKIHASCSNLH